MDIIVIDATSHLSLYLELVEKELIMNELMHQECEVVQHNQVSNKHNVVFFCWCIVYEMLLKNTMSWCIQRRVDGGV